MALRGAGAKRTLTVSTNGATLLGQYTTSAPMMTSGAPNASRNAACDSSSPQLSSWHSTRVSPAGGVCVSTRALSFSAFFCSSSSTISLPSVSATRSLGEGERQGGA